MGKLGARLLLLAGIVFTAATGWLAVTTGAAWLRSPHVPTPSTIALAADEQWVRLEDAVPSCDTRVVQHGFTYFLAADRAGGGTFLVHLVGDVPCDAARIHGGFLPGRYTREFLQKRLEVTMPGDGDLRFFTEAYSRDFRRRGFLRALPWLGFGLLLVVVGLRAVRRERAARKT